MRELYESTIRYYYYGDCQGSESDVASSSCDVDFGNMNDEERWDWMLQKQQLLDLGRFVTGTPEEQRARREYLGITGTPPTQVNQIPKDTIEKHIAGHRQLLGNYGEQPQVEGDQS